jgi:hypothetical protein
MERATWVATHPEAVCCGVGGRLSEAKVRSFTELLRFMLSSDIPVNTSNRAKIYAGMAGVVNAKSMVPRIRVAAVKGGRYQPADRIAGNPV